MIDFFTDQTGGILHKVPEMKKKRIKKPKEKKNNFGKHHPG